MVRLLISLWFIHGLANAAPHMEIDDHGNPVLAQYSKQGFVDCVFKIVDLVETDTAYQFRMVASYDGHPAGIGVSVAKGMQAGMDDEMELIKDHVYRNGVVFTRSGPESDRLIRALSTLYGKGARQVAMVRSESFTAIALHQGPLDMKQQAIKLKLFGRDRPTDSEGDYYELFFNLVLKEGLVFLNEKDQEYRPALLRALSK